jgi:hypothetical protein
MTIALRPAYLKSNLSRPLPTKDGGELRTVADARAYMLALAPNRELRTQWQHACALLLAQTAVAALTDQIELALFYDARLIVAAG